jgi:hypothetical protein
MRKRSEHERHNDALRAPTPIYNLTKQEKIVIKKTIDEDLRE